MTDDGLVEPLPWDTSFWGVSAARITARTPDELRAADAQCVAGSVRWSSTLVESSNFELLNDAVRCGHEIVDVRYTLARPLDDADASATVDLATSDDTDDMARIARSAFRGSSRFFADPHLDDDRCGEFYETWLRNSANGQLSDAIAVSRRGRLVEGFVTLRREPGGTASLPLVAVLDTARGRGVGATALTSALSWLAAKRAKSVSVTTQLSNVPALRLYQAAGFRTVGAGFWLHRWY